jgi:hypothetical protein
MRTARKIQQLEFLCGNLTLSSGGGAWEGGGGGGGWGGGRGRVVISAVFHDRVGAPTEVVGPYYRYRYNDTAQCTPQGLPTWYEMNVNWSFHFSICDITEFRMRLDTAVPVGP